jgi:uncharacterized protein (DUF4415 family)
MSNPDQAIDPDNPPMDEAFMAGMKPSRRGRPALDPGERKVPVTMRLSPDILNHFKEGGKGWQTRMEEALRKVAGLG